MFVDGLAAILTAYSASIHGPTRKRRMSQLAHFPVTRLIGLPATDFPLVSRAILGALLILKWANPIILFQPELVAFGQYYLAIGTD